MDKITGIVANRLTGVVDAGLIDYAVHLVGQQVLNYCHITDIPDGLVYTVADMVIKYINHQQSNDSPTANVKSVTMGDTSYTFSSDSTAGDVNDLIMLYRSDLNRYRKGLF